MVRPGPEQGLLSSFNSERGRGDLEVPASATWLRQRVVDWSAAAACATELANTQSAGQRFVLDLSTASLSGGVSATATRLNRTALLLLADLLIGEFQDLPLELHLTDDASLLIQLARGGVLYALANRGAEHLTTGDATPSRWSGRYNPRDQYHRQLGFQFPSAFDPGIAHAAVQRYLLGLPNAHERSYEELELLKKDPVQRWLTQRMTLSDPDNNEMEHVVESCGYVLTELLLNTKDHAAISGTPSGRSVALIYATLGGGSKSHNRIYFSVLDNGLGIVRSIQENFLDYPRGPERALTDLLNGKLPTTNRGFGIPDIRRICDDFSESHSATSIMIASFDPQEPSTAVWAEYSSTTQEVVVARQENLPLRGTLVHIVIPIGIRLGRADDQADQLELDIEPIELTTVS